MAIELLSPITADGGHYGRGVHVLPTEMAEQFLALTETRAAGLGNLHARKDFPIALIFKGDPVTAKRGTHRRLNSGNG